MLLSIVTYSENNNRVTDAVRMTWSEGARSVCSLGAVPLVERGADYVRS